MAGIDPDVLSLLSARNFAHVATLMPDGSPHSVAVWAGVEDGKVVFFTQETSQKARNLARDPRVALSVVDRENPYRTGRVRGRVEAVLRGEQALEVIDRLSERYTGAPFPMRSGIVFVIEPERSALMELPFSDPQA